MTTAAAELREGRRAIRWVPWIAPIAVLAVTRTSPSHVGRAIGLIITIAIVMAAYRFPRPAAVALVAALPLDLYGMAGLYRLGLTRSVLSPVRF